MNVGHMTKLIQSINLGMEITQLSEFNILLTFGTIDFKPLILSSNEMSVILAQV